MGTFPFPSIYTPWPRSLRWLNNLFFELNVALQVTQVWSISRESSISGISQFFFVFFTLVFLLFLPFSVVFTSSSEPEPLAFTPSFVATLFVFNWVSSQSEFAFSSKNFLAFFFDFFDLFSCFRGIFSSLSNSIRISSSSLSLCKTCLPFFLDFFALLVLLVAHQARKGCYVYQHHLC